MTAKLIPLFETHDRFLGLDHRNFSRELPVVSRYLESFPENVGAFDGYQAVRGFLRLYAANETTYATYRTYIERLLLWTLQVIRKPLLALMPQDCERFLEFCSAPPDDWVGPVTKGRFQRVGGRVAMPTDTFVVNPKWRPFTLTVRKADRKLAEEQQSEPGISPYKMKQPAVSMAFAVGGSFYEWVTEQGLTPHPNPFHSIKHKSRFTEKAVGTKADSLTPIQWDFVLETARMMADQEPEAHERTLFIVATTYSMYLKVTDVAGRDGRVPMMRDFRMDECGNWWMHVLGMDGGFKRISVKDEYMEVWMSRYRRFLGLPPVPTFDDDAPLLQSFKGHPGLSDRHIRMLVQGVFDRALERMRAAGFLEDAVKNLRAASLHWLRDTSAASDAKVRDHKHLQADLRHESVASTLDRYYRPDDEDRHRSNKNLRIKDAKGAD